MPAGLDLPGERGEERPGVLALPLKEGGHDQRAQTQLLGRLHRVPAGVRQGVQQVVGVVWERLRRLPLLADGLQVLHDRRRQPIREVVVTDHLPGVGQGRLVRTDRGRGVRGVRFGDVAGGLVAHRVGDAEADQFRARSGNPFGQHPAVRLGDVPADGIDLIDPCTALQQHVGGVHLVGECDAVDRAAHQGRGAAGDHRDEQVVRAGGVGQLKDLERSLVAGLVGQGVAAHENLRAVEPVGLLGDLDDGDASGEPVTEDLVDRHRHVVAGLAGAHQVDVPFAGEVPGPAADRKDVTLQVHDRGDPVVGVQSMEDPVGDRQHCAARLPVTGRDQLVEVLDLGHQPL